MHFRHTDSPRRGRLIVDCKVFKIPFY